MRSPTAASRPGSNSVGRSCGQIHRPIAHELLTHGRNPVGPDRLKRSSISPTKGRIAERTIKVVEVVESLDLRPDQTLPLALIANELLTNCFEHAFPDGSGTIQLKLNRVDQSYGELSVQDDGVGLSAHPSIQSSSLGSDSKLLCLLTSSAEQFSSGQTAVCMCGYVFHWCRLLDHGLWDPRSGEPPYDHPSHEYSGHRG